MVTPKLREHVLDALDREWRLAGLVARAVEADHEAVAHELVAAHALHRGEILDAFGVRRRCGDQEERRDDGREHVELFEPELFEGAHGLFLVQNGVLGELKKRDSQPGLVALATVPWPP